MLKTYDDLISVVVPIYNVEKYLKRCLDSIINQSYKNLEIILVDDGSPDLCGNICDSYENIDSRIKVIHQKNKGLSGARNAGINIATGTFIIFIDSDDYIDTKMIEKLFKNLIDTKSDISICGFYQIQESEIDNFNPLAETIYLKKLDKKKCLSELLFHKCGIDIVTWNKLYRRTLFENIVFPEGKIYEDFATIPYIIEKATNGICVTNEKLYYYIQRSGSINANSKFNKNIYHMQENLEIMNNFIQENHNDLYLKIIPGILFFNIIVVNEFFKYNLQKENKKIIKDFSKKVRKNLFNIICCNKLYFSQKIKLLLMSGVSLYTISYKVFRLFKKER